MISMRAISQLSVTDATPTKSFYGHLFLFLPITPFSPIRSHDVGHFIKKALASLRSRYIFIKATADYELR